LRRARNNRLKDHFADDSKMIEIGSGRKHQKNREQTTEANRPDQFAAEKNEIINHAVAIGRAGGTGGFAGKIESIQMSRSKERPIITLN